jgi:hypothetical protein
VAPNCPSSRHGSAGVVRTPAGDLPYSNRRQTRLSRVGRLPLIPLGDLVMPGGLALQLTRLHAELDGLAAQRGRLCRS